MINEIEKIIRDHLERQPYEVNCSECGKEVKYTKKIDNDLDIIVTVEPCTCKNE